ncbi:MAG: tetratricopeptide repeat protein [Aquificaceae bacterium]|nr:tetratricopeptide repeat protein [Aquificaceae bacterium]
MIKLFLLFFLLFSCAVKEEEKGKAQWQYYYDLGMSSYMAKNYSEAIANFFRASQLAPNEPKVWNALGLAYMEVQEHQKSETAFLRALQVDKAYTEAKLNLGVLYYRQRQYERSISTLREVLEDEAFPQKHMAFYYLGKAYQAMGNIKEYINNLRRATAYNPMFADAQLELAQAYENEGDYASAKNVYLSLINNGLVSPTIDLSMARVEYMLGNYASVKSHLKRVLEDKQTNPQLRSQAYDLLSQVLIAEQARLVQRVEKDRQPQQEKPPEPPAIPEASLRETAQENPQSRGRAYRIQVGAFSSANLARAWKDRLEKELGLKEVTVVEASGIFKVFYGAFNTKEEAQRELTRLKGVNIYGFIVNE